MSRQDDVPVLPNIVHRVEKRPLTLSVYNPDVGESVLGDIQSYFAVQTVDLQRAATDDGQPRNFAVLHDGDEFVAAIDLQSLYRVVRAGLPLLTLDEPNDVKYPDVVREIDQSVFTDYGRARMVTASREIEGAAAQYGGRLHLGFQRLSNLQPQYRFYDRLVESGVETHIYGESNWDVPIEAHTVHAFGDPEATKTWFVVLDTESSEYRHALLAEERSVNKFYGFWTFETDIVDAILARLTELRAEA